MIRSSRSRWVSGVGAMVLIGGLVLANYGSGVASAANNPPPNPFNQILNKLDQILASITGGGAGNHTLRWDTHNPSASRFTTAFPGAVLDKNTGLVWEQAPQANTRRWAQFSGGGGGGGGGGTTIDESSFGATFSCVNKTVGGTVGWRLPSVAELKSVQDPSLSAPFVPASVFTGVQSARYWSASTFAPSPTSAWVVGFDDGFVGVVSNSNLALAWCVRGPMQESVY